MYLLLLLRGVVDYQWVMAEWEWSESEEKRERWVGCLRVQRVEWESEDGRERWPGHLSTQ